MARIFGKTFESFNSMLNSTGILSHNREKYSTKLIPWKIDLDAFSWMIKDAGSKKTEENIINSYIAQMSKRLSEPEVSGAEVHEMIKICMACEAIGYPTPFIYVHCLKLVQTGNLQEKQTGYTAAAYFLHPHHELVILSINTFQKDLSSTNYLEVLLALRAICSLINTETVNHVLYLIVEKLKHEKSCVRKCAILTLNHCLQLLNSESAFLMTVPKLERALTDNNLEVVAVAVPTLYKILQKLPRDSTYLIKSLVNLQDQILLRRVPRSMVYCDIPAPWLQLDILKFLKFLCCQPEHYQEVVPILKKTLQQACLQNNVANAISYQVIETVTVMQPGAELVEILLGSVSHFLKSKDINLKLTGIEAAISVVKHLNPSVTSAQRDIIYECLNFPDETIQYKTLELLYHLTNASNVSAIVEKLMEFMVVTTNVHKKKELALNVVQLAEKFMADKREFITVCVNLLKHAGDVLSQEDVYRIIEYSSKDEELKEATLNTCFAYFQQHQPLHPSIFKMIASALDTSYRFEKFLPHFLKSDLDEETWMWLLMSLSDIVLKTKDVSPTLSAIIKEMKLKHDIPAQMLTQLLRIFDSDFIDYNPEETIDPSLSFLDDLVVTSLEKSESPVIFLPASFRLQDYPVTEAECISATNSVKVEESVTSPSQKSGSYSIFSSPSTSFKSLPFGKGIYKTTLPQVHTWSNEGREESSAHECANSELTSNQEDKTEEISKLFAGVS